MRITHCLLSCNSNPAYLEFWPVVANACLNLGMRPVLFYIVTDKNALPAAVAGGTVHTFEPLPDISIKIQASILRYWGCRWYLNDIVMAGEMDLIPLSRKFFIDRLRDIDDNSYVQIPASPRLEYGIMTSADILHGYPIEKAKYLQACHHIGRGEVMSRVWDFSDSWEASCRQIIPYWYKVDGPGKPIPLADQIKHMQENRQPFRGDEIYPSLRVALLQQQEKERIELLPYSQEEFDWICRVPPTPDRGLPDNYSEENLRLGYYSAVHAPRPYSRHRTAIDRLLNLNAALLDEQSG